MNLLVSLLTIFIIILLGIFCSRRKTFSAAQIEGFELLLFRIILPAYLFTVAYKNDLRSLLNLQYILAYLFSFIVLLAILFPIFIRRAPATNSCMRILASGYINAAIYALPIITFLLKDSIAAVITTVVQIIIIQPVFVVCLSNLMNREKSLASKLFSIFASPLITMTMLGLLLNYLQITLPEPIINAVYQLGFGAVGLALLTFGLSLGAMHFNIKAFNFDLLSIVFAKNFIHPIIAIGIGYLMQLPSYWFNSLVIAASAPTAFTIYLLSKQYATEVDLVKKSVAISSVISTVFLIIISIIFI